jgi:hypothetical protein
VKEQHFCAYAVLLFTFCVISPTQKAIDLSKLKAHPTGRKHVMSWSDDVHAVRTEKERVDASVEVTKEL